MTDEVSSAADPGPAEGLRIVVGVDGSEASKAALRWAIREAGSAGGVVEAILAWEFPIVWRGWIPPADQADFEADAGRMLRSAVDEVAEAVGPVEIRPRVMRGHPAAVLLQAALGAHLLVVGHRGRGGFAGALLGSISYHCVLHAPCPVLVVRGAAA